MNKIYILLLCTFCCFLSCTDDEIDIQKEWNGSARKWEHLEGGYRGWMSVDVDGNKMDHVIQQVKVYSDDYDQVHLLLSGLQVGKRHYGNFHFQKIEFQTKVDENQDSIIWLKAKQNQDNATLGLLNMKIEGYIKNEKMTFVMSVEGLESLKMNIAMSEGRYMAELPSAQANVLKMILSDEPFISGTPDINGQLITFYVADSLQITDSTHFSVLPKFELSPGAWVEPDTLMYWKLKQSHDEETPSVITTDSSYHFNLDDNFIPIKIWANDSISNKTYLVKYAKSAATKLPLFHWNDQGEYMNPIGGWTSNNAYLHKLLDESVIKDPNIYVKRILGYNVGDIGAEIRTEVIGSMEDSTIQIVSGKLFRGTYSLDSLDTPKKGEMHGVLFKGKPVTLRGYYQYTPGETLHIRDSILPDTIRNHTDSCYIEAFLYEAPLATTTLDSLDYLKDPKIVAHGKFIGGKKSEYVPFSLSFTVRNWLPNKRYHLGVVCRSSGRADERIGADGSILRVSGMEVMSSMNVYH